MLQHEQPHPEQATSPAQNRVTPEELAKALAAIEARKDQSAREAAATISIGEALQQLGLEATPDDIWAEVQAQRRKHTRKRQPWPLRRRLLTVVPVATILMVGVAEFFGYSDHPLPSVVATASTPKTTLETLAEVPDNGSFYCDGSIARKILMQKLPVDPKTLVIAGRPITDGQTIKSWQFTKYGGHLYIHGFTAPRSASAIKLGHMPVVIGTEDETNNGKPNYDQEVTLQVGTFHVDSTHGEGFGEGFDNEFGIEYFVVSDIHPDKHFNDSYDHW